MTYEQLNLFDFDNEEPNLKAQMCRQLIESGAVHENDVIRHSYTKNRMEIRNGENGNPPSAENNMSPTLDTRCDCLGVVTKDEPETKEISVKECVDKGLSIRKLTPKECWRLMGVKDEDSSNCNKNQSNASMYHLAGDSIVTSVLMAIFGELLGIDWNIKVDELVNELRER